MKRAAKASSDHVASHAEMGAERRAVGVEHLCLTGGGAEQGQVLSEVVERYRASRSDVLRVGHGEPSARHRQGLEPGLNVGSRHMSARTQAGPTRSQ